MKHFVHFLWRQRKRTKRKRPCYAALRAALCFSKRAGVVELATLKQLQLLFRPLLRCSARHKGEAGQNQLDCQPPSRRAPDSSRSAGGDSKISGNHEPYNRMLNLSLMALSISSGIYAGSGLASSFFALSRALCRISRLPACSHFSRLFRSVTPFP
jgi:hypothetical protein